MQKIVLYARGKSFEYFVLEKIDKKGKIIAVVRANSGEPELKVRFFAALLCLIICVGHTVIRESA